MLFINLCIVKNEMSCKKRKLTEETRLFRQKSVEYFSVEFEQKTRLICTEAIALAKDCNLIAVTVLNTRHCVITWKDNVGMINYN